MPQYTDPRRDKRRQHTSQAQHTRSASQQSAHDTEENEQRPHTAPTKAQRAAFEKRRQAKKRAYRRRVVLVLFMVLFCVGAVGTAVYAMFNSAFTGGGGTLPNEINTPAELKGDVVNFLVCGIDFEEGRDYGKSLGMTDVIMYVTLDIKANKISILQIPRDTYVGTQVATGGTTKINAVAYRGSEEPKITNLARLIKDQFDLPVDYYITIDMDAFKAVINAIGGIEMNIPWDVPYYNEDGSLAGTIPAGLQKIDGATAEVVVRSRKGYAQGDIKRLDMQRYFYAAVFQKLVSFPVTDVIKVLPAYMQYVQTDLSLAKMGSVLGKVMKIPVENITMYKVPGESLTYNGQSVYSVHLDMLVQRLNEGFRPYSTPLTASDLKVIELAHTNDYITGEGTSLSGMQTS